MKTPVKAVITTDTKSLNKDGILHLHLSGDNLKGLKYFLHLRKLRPGSVVVMQLLDKESKSYKQLKTVHLLIRIYDTFLQGNVEGYIDTDRLKKEIKFKYGIIDYDTIDGKEVASLKSFSDYKLEEMSPVIDGLIQEMVKVFAEYNWEDKRFDLMVREFHNSDVQKVKNVFELY